MPNLVPIPTADPDGVGTVTTVRGSVVDVRFPSRLPPLRQRLLAGRRSDIVLEVSEHLSPDTVRGVALTATACNTVKGVGRDIESVGDAADRAL